MLLLFTNAFNGTMCISVLAQMKVKLKCWFYSTEKESVQVKYVYMLQTRCMCKVLRMYYVHSSHTNLVQQPKYCSILDFKRK